MKSKFLLTLATITVLLVGCSKEEVGNAESTSSVKKSFMVKVDDAQTRAEVTNLSRYVMEVYEGSTATGTPTIHREQATGVFNNVILKDKQTYTVLFWADYGTPSADGTHPVDNEYNASDLKAARVAEGKQPDHTAFAGVSKFTIGTDQEETYTAVKLTHATAQVHFKQTEVLTSETNTLVVKYPESYSLNVENMSVTKLTGEVSHSFTYNSKAIGTLGTSYIIAATGGTKTVMNITATMTSGGITNNKELTNIPFERNYRTSIWGAYSNLYNSTLSVTCDNIWKEMLCVGDFFYSDKTYSTELNPNKTVMGIVFWIDPASPTKGKMVSCTDGPELMFSVTVRNFVNATSVNDGAGNTTKIARENSLTQAYPFIDYLSRWSIINEIEGISWYIPAIAELRIFSTKINDLPIKEIVNHSLQKLGTFNHLSGSYWSSTEVQTPFDTSAFYGDFDNLEELENYVYSMTQKVDLKKVRFVASF